MLGFAIVKSYAYYQTIRVLMDCPNVRATDAIRVSERLTQGHKWALFVNDLSFLGWFILSAMTFGILYIVYVGPYYQMTLSGFYYELKQDALRQGRITQDELQGAMLR